MYQPGLLSGWLPPPCPDCLDDIGSRRRDGPFLVACLKSVVTEPCKLVPLYSTINCSGVGPFLPVCSCIGESVDLSRIALDLGHYNNIGGVTLELRLTGREQKFRIALEVRVLERRTADGQVAVGKGKGEKVQIDGGRPAGVMTDDLELQGARAIRPVGLDVPGYAVDLVGSNGGPDLRTRAVHPCLGNDPFGRVIEGAVLGCEDAHGGVGVVRIDDLEVKVDYIGPGTLGDAPHGRLGDDVANR